MVIGMNCREARAHVLDVLRHTLYHLHLDTASDIDSYDDLDRSNVMDT